MNKLFKETGFPSEYGEEIFRAFLDKEVEKLLNSAETESELRILGAIISNRVGNMVANRIAILNKLKSE